MGAPIADEESRAYWEGLREGRLLVQQCGSCARHRFPPMPSCPWCGAPSGAAVEVAPRGTVYSWVVVHRALTPARADEVPYAVATVDLDAGCRVVARVEGTSELHAGLAVEGRFVDHGEWTELRVAPA